MKTLLIILCLISQAIRAQNDSNAYQNHLQKLHQKGDFNGTAIVIKNSNIIYSGAFGPADKDSIKRLDVNSVFRICSVSKQFTAMGILILKEKGKLKITDSIRQYIPECPYPNITIKHLLTHTSGLPDYMPVTQKAYQPEKKWWDYERLIPNKDSVINMLFNAHPKRLFAPGEKMVYSNTGYSLLAMITERVSKQSFAKFMKDNIFTPLEMNNTSVLHYIPGDTNTIQNRAFGYWKKNKNTIYEAEHHYLNCMQGEGGIFSNAPDLVKWDAALYTEKLVTKETLKEAFTGYNYFHKKENLKYGYGWGVKEENGETRITEHSGGWVGFRTYIFRDIKNKNCIILLCNNSKHKGMLSSLKKFKQLLAD